MAAIKSYTDLEQSRKLAEILPLESADMEYLAIKENGKLVGSVPFVKDDSEVEDSACSHIYDRIASWSLAALLGALPNPKVYQAIEGYWCCDCWKNTKDVKSDESTYIGCTKASNSIDACVGMIERLHELNLL